MRCANSPIVTTNLFPDGTQGDIFEVLSVVDDQPEYTVTEALYDRKTGEMEIFTAGVRMDIPVGSKVNLSGLVFQCSSSGLPGELTYPADPNIAFDVIARPGNSRLVVQAGVSTIRHTFVPGLRQGVAPIIKQLPTKFTAHVGTVGFDHTYFAGGTAWRQSPFSVPQEATQIRDVSIQFDPLQNTNSTPNACKNVFSAIENCVVLLLPSLMWVLMVLVFLLLTQATTVRAFQRWLKFLHRASATSSRVHTSETAPTSFLSLSE